MNKRKIIEALSSPIITQLWLFLSLVVAQSMSGIVYMLIFVSKYSLLKRIFLSFEIFFYPIVITYVFLLIRQYLRKTWRNIFTSVFIALIAIHQIVNVFCIFTMYISFNQDFAGVIAGTNMGETSEFFSTYLSAKVWFEILLYVVSLAALIILLKKLAPKLAPRLQTLKSKTLLVAFMIFSVVVCYIWRDGITYEESIVGFSDIISSYEKVEAIEPTNPKLCCDSCTQVPKIVVIIGESFQKYHSNLYGYDKVTNPRLAALPDSLLHVYKHVQAPDTHTVQAFSCFMTTSEKADIPQCYKCPNIVEIAKKTGYATTWISNQSRAGKLDNKVTIFANLCDTSIWNGEKFTASMKTDIDGGLLTHLDDVATDAQKTMLFVHLMGSHPQFSLRYTNEYDVFTPSDYPQLKDNQKETVAQYDNSVLYNDFIVSSILKHYAKDDAVIVYFSDHAIDIYNSDDNFCAHAKPGDKKSQFYGTQIPFMIYTSAKFRQNHKDLTQMIEQSADTEFNTTNLPYLLMQLMGVTFTDRDNKFPLHK